MDEVGVLDPAEHARGDDDLVQSVEVRVRAQGDRERDVLLDGHLMVGDPGDPDDVARGQAGAERPVDLVKGTEGDVGGGEEIGDGAAHRAGRHFPTAINEGHREPAIERQALSRNNRRLDWRGEPVPRPGREPKPAERIGHRLGRRADVRAETVDRHRQRGGLHAEDGAARRRRGTTSDDRRRPRDRIWPEKRPGPHTDDERHEGQPPKPQQNRKHVPSPHQVRLPKSTRAPDMAMPWTGTKGTGKV